MDRDTIAAVADRCRDLEQTGGRASQKPSERNRGGFAALHPGLRVGVIVGVGTVVLVVGVIVGRMSVGRSAPGPASRSNVNRGQEHPDVAEAKAVILRMHPTAEFLAVDAGYRVVGQPGQRLVLVRIKTVAWEEMSGYVILSPTSSYFVEAKAPPAHERG